MSKSVFPTKYAVLPITTTKRTFIAGFRCLAFENVISYNVIQVTASINCSNSKATFFMYFYPLSMFLPHFV